MPWCSEATQAGALNTLSRPVPEQLYRAIFRIWAFFAAGTR